MADKKKATPAAQAANKAAAPKPKRNLKEERNLRNLQQHADNLAKVRELGLQPETTERIIQRVVKRGSKTSLTTTSVVKNKRPSKLLRKYDRRDLRENIGKRNAEIDALHAKVITETPVANRRGSIKKKEATNEG